MSDRVALIKSKVPDLCKEAEEYFSLSKEDAELWREAPFAVYAIGWLAVVNGYTAKIKQFNVDLINFLEARFLKDQDDYCKNRMAQARDAIEANAVTSAIYPIEHVRLCVRHNARKNGLDPLYETIRFNDVALSFIKSFNVQESEFSRSAK